MKWFTIMAAGGGEKEEGREEEEGKEKAGQGGAVSCAAIAGKQARWSCSTSVVHPARHCGSGQPIAHPTGRAWD